MARGQIEPRVQAVEQHLAAHPGQHRARDVARALGLTNHKAALSLYQLERTGRARRERRTEPGQMPYSLWSAPDHGSATPHEGDTRATTPEGPG